MSDTRWRLAIKTHCTVFEKLKNTHMNVYSKENCILDIHVYTHMQVLQTSTAGKTLNLYFFLFHGYVKVTDYRVSVKWDYVLDMSMLTHSNSSHSKGRVSEAGGRGGKEGVREGSEEAIDAKRNISILWNFKRFLERERQGRQKHLKETKGVFVNPIRSSTLEWKKCSKVQCVRFNGRQLIVS